MSIELVRSEARHSQELAQLHTRPGTVLAIKGKKLLAALDMLAERLDECPSKRAKWRDEARVAAVLGSCPRSTESHSSGVRHWLRYIKVVYGAAEQEKRAFPPHVQDILGWSNTFQCVGTFANYLSYVRTACHALGCAAPPVGDTAIRRGMIAIAKRELFTSREPMFIDRVMVNNMVRAVQRGWEDKPGAALWLTSYLFLLRVPSEALPACKGSPDNPDVAEKQTLIWREGDDVCLRLRRRKNRPQGSGILRRGCTCRGGATHMCAVHGLWDTFLEDLPEGHQPWQSIGPSQARRRLRDLLQRFLVPDAQKYGTQDFRRGHAEDMRKAGCTLAEILRAGQWRSAAFMTYMDQAGIDKVSLSAISLSNCCNMPMSLCRTWRSSLPCKAMKNGLTKASHFSKQVLHCRHMNASCSGHRLLPRRRHEKGSANTVSVV